MFGRMAVNLHRFRSMCDTPQLPGLGVSKRSGQCANFSAAASARPAVLDASRLTVSLKEGPPTPLPPLDQLKFGHFFTDHILEVDWDKTKGWDAPQIHPLRPLSLHPGVSSLHYAIQIFEGMKAYMGQKGNILMFRPEQNMARFNRSAHRMALPHIDEKALLKLISKLLVIERSFLPAGEGFSLYVRPSLFSTQPTLGVCYPEQAKLLVMLCPCGPYFASGFAPVQLLADTMHTRAFPGGVGDVKTGSNYGPTIYPQHLGAERGYSQILWLYPTQENDHIMTEVGTMNLFIHWINPEGHAELVTAPLGHNLTLPGITRDCVMELAEKVTGLPVREKYLMMKRDFIKALNEKRILGAFGTGTAAIICPIDAIKYEGIRYSVPTDDPANLEKTVTKSLLKEIFDIQYGVIDHPWSFEVESSARD